MAKPKFVDVTVSVHKDVPACCRSALTKFAAHDVYRGHGEPGDKIRCGCGNWLVLNWRGWRIAA